MCMSILISELDAEEILLNSAYVTTIPMGKEFESTQKSGTDQVRT